MWATSLEAPQFGDDNREVYHLFKDLLTKTEGETWFEKVKDGDGRRAHLLLREHYVGEAHDMRRAASANAKLETLLWKSEASFPFEKYLTRLNKAFKELEDAGQPLWEAQKVTHLLKGIQNDDIQVQTTIGLVRQSFLSNFEEASLALLRAVSSRFASVEHNKQKRRIGAIESRSGGRSGGRGRGRGRNSGGRSGGRDGNNRMRVVMNGVDVTDTSRNFTSDEWDKLRACGGHSYVAQRREYLCGRTHGRGGRGGCGGRNSDASNSNSSGNNVPRNISANVTNVTDTHNTETQDSSTIASQSTRGSQNCSRFGPRRTD
jgi:hypothetical protein